MVLGEVKLCVINFKTTPINAVLDEAKPSYVSIHGATTRTNVEAGTSQTVNSI